jgi:hypothetical protein
MLHREMWDRPGRPERPGQLEIRVPQDSQVLLVLREQQEQLVLQVRQAQ